MEQEPLTQIDISHRLRIMMVHSELTVSDMAALAGVSKSTMEKYLSGPSSPRATAILSLARALNVTTDYILDGQLEVDASAILSASRITLRDLLTELLSDEGLGVEFRSLASNSEEAKDFVRNVAFTTSKVIRNRAIDERDEMKRSGEKIAVL